MSLFYIISYFYSCFTVLLLLTWSALVIGHCNAVWQHSTPKWPFQHLICRLLGFYNIVVAVLCQCLCTHFAKHNDTLSYAAIFFCSTKSHCHLYLFALYPTTPLYSFVSPLLLWLKILFHYNSSSGHLQFLAVQHLAVPVNKKPNLVGKPSDHGEGNDDAVSYFLTWKCCRSSITLLKRK